jgi:hypothetical protein
MQLHRFQRYFGGQKAEGAFGLALEPVAGSALPPHQPVALHVDFPAQHPTVINPALAP